MARRLIAGNWKMNGLPEDLAQVRMIVEGLDRIDADQDYLLCPPFTLISQTADLASGSRLGVGAQDCSKRAAGAHTGDICAHMIKAAGAAYVILGHSERRGDHGETNAMVAEKTAAAVSAGLTPIICVGESEAQRRAGETIESIGAQVDASAPDMLNGAAFCIAYEPIWAIGTGLTPSIADIEDVHDFLRERLEHRFGDQANDTPLLYGGSVKPGNAAEILAARNVDGALVGGASLKASDFLAICAANSSARRRGVGAKA